MKNAVRRIMPLHMKEKIRWRNLKTNANDMTEINALKSRIRKIIVLGCPNHGNVGDQAIVIAMKGFIEEYFPDVNAVYISFHTCRCLLDKVRKYIHKDDIIFVCGGGWFGSLWRHNEDTIRAVLNGKNNKTVIFPQTVYFSNDSNSKLDAKETFKWLRNKKNLLISVRDKKSYSLIKERANYLNVLLVPDIVLSLRREHTSIEKHGVLLCIRDDMESTLNEKQRETLVRAISKLNLKRNEFRNVYKELEIFTNAERLDLVEQQLTAVEGADLLITDRLHPMIFSLIVGTPCIAYDNSTGKVAGMLKLVGEQNAVKLLSGNESEDEIIDAVSKLMITEHDFDMNNLKPIYMDFAEKIRLLIES